MFDELIDTLADRISERIKDNLADTLKASSEEMNGYRDGELFARLRKRIADFGLTHSYFANKINVSPATLSKRINNKSPWLLTEMYQAMEVLQIPHDRMHDYFPKGGKA
jgi:hypothetical protein